MRAAVVAIAALAATSAAAQQPACMPIDQLQQILRERYREAPVVMARIDDGNVLVIYAADDGSWTAAIVSPSGISCVVSTGAALRFIRQGA
ncbi:MAG: hypothetical protein FJ184_13300 [Gammaproteobacteria bacterium]|nr:hypothetical protein [Gammaproteobacteria bacterium]